MRRRWKPYKRKTQAPKVAEPVVVPAIPIVPKPVPLPPDALLTVGQACEFVSHDSKTLSGWRKAGRFPEPDIVKGRRTKFYRVETLTKWLRANGYAVPPVAEMNEDDDE